ncbi:MAG: hypothetical protein ACXW3Z_02490 [Limisphaerales bacterium]
MLAARASNPHIGNVLPDEQATPEQIAIFKAMTPQQRWHAARACIGPFADTKPPSSAASIPIGPIKNSSRKSEPFFSVPEADLLQLFVYPSQRGWHHLSR